MVIIEFSWFSDVSAGFGGDQGREGIAHFV